MGFRISHELYTIELRPVDLTMHGLNTFAVQAGIFTIAWNDTFVMSCS